MNRRHSIRFSRSKGGQPLGTMSPSESISSSFSSPHSNGGSSFSSPTSRALNERQLYAITKSFGSPKGSDDDYFSADDQMMTPPMHSHSASSFDGTNRRVRGGKGRSSLESSDISFHSARASLDSEVANDSSSIPYTWNGVQVATAKGHWEIWLLGAEGFLDGEEGGEVKILANSWSKLMEFCAAHQRVVIGRNTAKFFTRDPVVVRVRLLERSSDGMELSLSLEKVRHAPVRKSVGGSTLLAFQLPTPTTLGQIAKLCKKGSLGQGA